MASIEKVEEIQIDNAIFDSICDCTYVLLCIKNENRLNSVKKNIEILKPTKNVKLIFSKGYKLNPNATKPNQDLYLSQIYIFDDAIKNNYERILFLEDDFFLRQPLTSHQITSINQFLKKNNPSLYSLGSFIWPTPLSYLQQHHNAINNRIGCTHALFYNKDAMEIIGSFFKNNSDNIDITIDSGLIYIKKKLIISRYYKPLVYQLFTDTDNKKLGWDQCGYFFQCYIIKLSIKLFSMYEKEEPGWNVWYIFPLILYIIILIIIILILIKILKKRNSLA
tara:strand:- start:2466 stop:3302 length:837 start_codon:yes stop_codon:yes gene_type:complete